MPRPYQIIPQNSFPTEETYVNDNTVVTPIYSDSSSDTVSFLIATASPKGIDSVVQTIRGQQEFVDKIGIGPFSLYGQPLLTAYGIASTGNATLHVLRVVDDAAKYANVTICAKYLYDNLKGSTTVKFVAHTSTDPLGNLEDLADSYKPSAEPDEDGYTEVKLFSVAVRGKGSYGNKFQIRLSTLKNPDRENDFKNYSFEIHEAGKFVEQKEAFHICFSENAIVGETSYFADSVIMDPINGSEYITFVSYPEGFQKIVDVYNQGVAQFNSYIESGAGPHPIYPSITHIDEASVDSFDFFGSIDKITKEAIPLYTIDTDVSTDATVVSPYGVDGSPDIFLSGGDDGKLAENYDFSAEVDSEGNPITRQDVLNALYVKAYGEKIDPMIVSKNKFPTTFIPDCNFPQEVKMLIHALNEKRTDSIALFDAGTLINTHQSVFDTCKAYFNNCVSRDESVDAYCGKVRDPYNKKLVTVTSVYALCLMYASQFRVVSGKHVPLADNAYGHLYDVFIQNTIYPVFDEDIHTDMMNELIDERINFARMDATMSVKRATQTTRQVQKSVLSELNCALILKDVKRAMEKMCATHRYNFADADDIVRFNKDAEYVTNRFSNQVTSITAYFDQNDYEASMNYIHLYVTIVNKNIVKTTIIEIDVNRA